MDMGRRLKFERLRRIAFVISFGIAVYILWGWFILHSAIDLVYEKSRFNIGKVCFAVIGFIVVILVLGSQI